MTLKVIRGPVTVGEDRQAPDEARELAFRCQSCGKLCYGTLPFYVTPVERQRIIKAALDEHRKVCTVGAAADQRSYDIWYPRK